MGTSGVLAASKRLEPPDIAAKRLRMLLLHMVDELVILSPVRIENSRKIFCPI